MSAKIIITSSDGQQTLENVNPTVSSTTLAQFSQKLNALTDNIYQKIDRIHKLNCDSEHLKSLLLTSIYFV